MFLIVPGPVVSGLLIYTLILNKYHKKYDEIEYKVISKQENMLLWTTYICFGITIIAIFLIPNEISYNLMNVSNTLALVITLCFAVLVPIAILLQKEWTLFVKWRNTILTEIVFVSVGFIVNILVNMPVPFPQIILVMHFTVPGTIVSGFLIYALILNKYHKKYDEIEYKVISKQENMLLWTTYICFGITIIAIFLIPNEIYYNLMNVSNPLALVITLCFAVLVPIAILLQKEWTLFVKFINIILTEIVFVSVSFIVNILVNMDIFGQVLTPFAPLAGCVLLRYVFINSSLFIVNILVNMDIFGQVLTPFAPLAGCVLLRYVFINSSLNSVEDKEL